MSYKCSVCGLFFGIKNGCTHKGNQIGVAESKTPNYSYYWTSEAYYGECHPKDLADVKGLVNKATIDIYEVEK